MWLPASGRSTLKAFATAGLLLSVLAGGATHAESPPWAPGRATPGARLELVEVTRTTHADATLLVTYRLAVSGLASEQECGCWIRSGFAPAREFGRYVFSPGRGLASKSGGGPLSDLGIGVGNFQRGLAFSVALISSDDAVRAYARVIPFPIEGRDGRCRVWLELMSRDGAIFAAHVQGFLPGESVTITAQSDGERLVQTVIADADGALPARVLDQATVAKGQTAGLQASTRTCAPRVDYALLADLRKCVVLNR